MTQAEVFAKFDKFLSDNNNKFVERVDSNALNQCFDLAIFWCEYLGLPQNIFAGLYYAYQIWYPSTTTAVQNFNYIENGPNDIPIKGDMVIWKPGYNGGAGHVGMTTGNATLYWFDCFEQNDPVRSNSHVRRYNYDYVYGWLRLKTTAPTNPYEDKWKKLKVGIDRLKAEADTDNNNPNKEAVYNATKLKIKKLYDTDSL